MNKEEFIKYIKSIGFLPFEEIESGSKTVIVDGIIFRRSFGDIWIFKQFKIELYNNVYNFYNGLIWSGHYYEELTPIKKLIRNIRLNELLDE